MIPHGQLIKQGEKHGEKLATFASQPEDYERCESMELDSEIRDLVEMNASRDPKGVTREAMPSHQNSYSRKTPGKTASPAHFALVRTRMSAAEGSTELTELLEVNQQWDYQFRSMKELYEGKVAELRRDLHAAQRLVSLRAGQRHPSPDQLRPLQKETENLNEELHELKKENKLLKEKNALANKKNEHYECEIKRLNKALQDALKIECPSLSTDLLGTSEMKCSHEEMRTEMEVLKHQVQIYEEDFKKERSDRERLSQEKEELQQVNQTSQSQLNRLNSQIKACQMEKEKLEKQLKQMHFPTCHCDVGRGHPQVHRDEHPGQPACRWGPPHSVADRRSLQLVSSANLQVTAAKVHRNDLSKDTQVCINH
ncbi:TNFAIP3-interacting protein 3 isoform X2 [Tamandua tetradactyla]|uniref:TNFAIP3-interacting protein 3 isoform X2 n=1 Tax=Tamandua tetradactyla TaxID=48850 RepID=UPI004053F3B2